MTGTAVYTHCPHQGAELRKLNTLQPLTIILDRSLAALQLFERYRLLEGARPQAAQSIAVYQN